VSVLTDQQLADAARAAGFPAAQIPTAVAIARAESSGNSSATHVNNNGSTDYGVWQINSVHGNLLAGQNWSDPAANAKMAYQVWQSSGWNAWSTYKSGAYQKYLNGAPVTAPGGPPGAPGAPGGPTAAAGTTTNAFLAIPGLVELLTAITQFLVGDPARPGSHGLSFLLLPTTWVRVMCGVGGAVILFLGLLSIIREVRT